MQKVLIVMGILLSVIQSSAASAASSGVVTTSTTATICTSLVSQVQNCSCENPSVPPHPDCFIYDRTLKTMDLNSYSNVASIGHYFLNESNKFEAINLSPFSNVKSIGSAASAAAASANSNNNK